MSDLTAVVTAAVLVGGVLAAVVRLEIRASLTRLKLELLAELDNRYVLRREYEASQKAHRRLDDA